MSVSKFLQAFIFMLFIPLITLAARERVLMSHGANAHRDRDSTQELSKEQEEPVHIEKFIVQTIEPESPPDTKVSEAEAQAEQVAAQANENSSIPRKVNLNIPAPSLFASVSRRLTLLDKTYLDVYTILRESNSCSQFFGGPRIATSILNFLHPRLKETSLRDYHVAISMFGSISIGRDFQTGVRFRLFQRALVNLRGPFYQSVNHQSQDFFNKIGHFPANTREARATILLHELGHLLSGADGGWLLPDDGGDPLQIAANTATIMNKCSEQINSLKVSGQR